VLTISSEGTWPFSLVGRVGITKYSYTPRSDFLFSLNSCPFILIEECSDRQKELDRYRLLLQAGLLVRVMNSFTQEPFVAVAIYITAQYVAERYLVFQPSKGDRTVRNTNVFIADLCSSIVFF